jgi:dTDP-4-dehydrorhamnose reductase
MNILVTGANGQLGTEIRRAARRAADRFIFSDISSLPGSDTLYLDITDKTAVSLVCESEKVDVVINCAAYVDVEKAESDMAMASLLNEEGPANLAAVCAKRGALLIHISTDYVFGGDIPMPIREDAPVAPTGVYGATKLQGERAILASGCKSIIFRTSWLYSPWGKNFVKTMRTLTAQRKNLSVVFDQVGSPTYAGDLADCIMHVIESRQLNKLGIYHYADEGVCSWYDFACAIRDIAGNKCDIRPCHSGEYPSKVKRPSYSVLDKTLVKNTFGITIPHWHDSLCRCMARIDKA